MSTCKLNHSLDDVKKKLREQSPFLEAVLVEKCTLFLETELKQSELNELFHLLKKYDLSSAEEKNRRNAEIEALITL